MITKYINYIYLNFFIFIFQQMRQSLLFVSARMVVRKDLLKHLFERKKLDGTLKQNNKGSCNFCMHTMATENLH